MPTARFKLVKRILLAYELLGMIGLINVAVSGGCVSYNPPEIGPQHCTKFDREHRIATLVFNLLFNCLILWGLWNENRCLVTTVAVLHVIAASGMVFITIYIPVPMIVFLTIIAVVVAGLFVAMSRFMAYGEGKAHGNDVPIVEFSQKV